jgi:hypothetical protein
MPYIINNTNGTIVATVQDASLDRTTDLIFVGRNYAGYGEIQNENFLKLLENFAKSTPPPRPIGGQLWYDTANKRLSIYDTTGWKGIANLEIADLDPSAGVFPKAGDLWYDKVEQQLHVYNGSEYRLVGPLSGAATLGQWFGSYEISTNLDKKFVVKAVVGTNEEVIAVVSDSTFSVEDGPARSDEYPFNGTEIKRGITLIGANPITGVSAVNTSTGSLLWGSAAHALTANIALSSSGLTIAPSNSSSEVHFPYFGLPTSGGAGTVNTDTGFKYIPASNTLIADVFQGIATSARFADLAERYAADAVYGAGTVVIIGGDAEITVTSKRANTAVAGVISQDPGFKMNSDAGSDLTHPYVALKGRVPCKVSGTIKKGDMLVTSKRDGYAEAWKTGDSPSAVIGKALENFEGLYGVIEIKI